MIFAICIILYFIISIIMDFNANNNNNTDDEYYSFDENENEYLDYENTQNISIT